MSAANVPAEPPSLPFPLQDGERVIELRRRHWWYLWPNTAVLVLVAVVPVIFLTWLFDAIGVLDDLRWIFWIIALIWIAIWGIRALLNWYRYHHDIWVVTNQRLIDSYRANPFSRRVATADLINVQDMSVSKNGILPNMLNFGDVLCETAGSSTSTFKITGIPRPEDLQLLIDKERDRERMRSSGGAPPTP